MYVVCKSMIGSVFSFLSSLLLQLSENVLSRNTLAYLYKAGFCIWFAETSKPHGYNLSFSHCSTIFG